MSADVVHLGAPLPRVDGRAKVTGAARYAAEHQVDGMTYVFPIQSTIAKGRVEAIDASAALALPGVVAILSHQNAPCLEPIDRPEAMVFQSDAVAYYGQFVAAVVAETLEIAREAADLVKVRYHEQPHDVDFRANRGDLSRPARLNGGYATDTDKGNVEAALATAAISIDHTYITPYEHNNPMGPHATIANWTVDGLLLYDSNQGPHTIRGDVARAFALHRERVRVISPYVGGAFGSKAFTHPHVILAVMAARMTERPAKLVLTRQQMFAATGYRTPTIQRLRLGADSSGRLTALSHDVVEQTSALQEFAEQTAVVSRVMYTTPNLRTTHRLARLDVPVPTIMRAPGECPGMYALECAVDELAIRCDLDPIELRRRNEPSVDPESGKPFSSRGLVACLDEGAARFGWKERKPIPRSLRDGDWWVGMGVAASTYPTRRRPAHAAILLDCDNRYTVRIDASDIGTGAWTVLTQIAANALHVPADQVRVEIGDSDLPQAPGAGGSQGTASWGTAVLAAAVKMRALLRERDGVVPDQGLIVTAETGANPEVERFSMHAFGAQFAEVRVNAITGEVRVPHLTGVFAAGRIINARTARSQFVGGMTMGMSMALEEQTVLDHNFGHFATHDLAEYHVAVSADVGVIDIGWIEEDDPHVNPLGLKGIGELGITGTAAAVANAVYNATGVRVRDLPITPDKLAW